MINFYETRNTQNNTNISTWMMADSCISLAGSRFIDRLPRFSNKNK